MQRFSHLLKNTQLFTRTHVFRYTVTSNAATKEDVELKSWKEIPGPSSLPLVGPLRHFVPGGFLYKHTGTKLTQKLYETYGDIVRFDALPGLGPAVFLFDPESVSKVIREEDTYPIRTTLESMKYYRTTNNRLLGLLADGEPWKKLRTTVNPVLLMPKTIKLYAGTLDTVALDMVERIRKIKDDEIKIQNTFLYEINLWALESIGTVTLGCRIGCLEPNLPDDSPASKMIKCSKAFTTYLDKLDFKPNIWKYVPTKTFKRAMKSYEEHEKLCKYFINKSRKELMNNPKNDDEKGILEKLLEINEDVANVIASDMMIGGIDTVNVIFLHQDMSVMEKHFMKSKEYIPERWLADSTDPLCYKNAHPFAYMPFGFGVRSCLGRRIVELQLETLLTRAVENFHWEWNGPPPEIYAGPFNFMKGPYNFKIHDLRK